jgi:hypothetical protein
MQRQHAGDIDGMQVDQVDEAIAAISVRKA